MNHSKCLQAMCIDRCQLQFNEIFIFISLFWKRKNDVSHKTPTPSAAPPALHSYQIVDLCMSSHILVWLLVVSNGTCKNYYLLKMMLANKIGGRERGNVCEQQDLNFPLFRVSFSHFLRRFNFVYMWCGMHFH